jgi:peptide/nickel transport system permease protein
LIHGTRTSLAIGATSAAIAAAIAIVIGVTSGYRGGLVEELLMASANIMLAFPAILLLLVIAVFVPVRSPMVVAFLIGFTSWPGLARAIRSQIMSLKEREFVFLSRMAGWSGSRVAFADLLPNMMTYVFTSSVVLMSAAMLAEAGLTMIGVGVTKGTSLGVMLFWAQLSDAVRRGLFWWFIPPGGMLTITCASLLLLATALDQFFNPRLKER